MRILLCLIISTVTLAQGRPAAAGPMPARVAFTYVSPLPGARYVRPEANLILRPSPALGTTWSPRGTVRGTLSGAHEGRWIRSDDTWIFDPDRGFDPGEKVAVSVAIGNGETTIFSFEVTPAALPPRSLERQVECLKAEPQPAPPATRPRNIPRTSSSPVPTPPGFPSFTITHSDGPADGYYFLANMAFSDTIYTPFHLIIIDNNGDPVFYRETWNAAVDFKKQPNGLLTYFVLGNEKFHAMDGTYTVVDSFEAGNGYTADFHDLQILPNGHALLLIYDPQPVDMSAVVTGGDPNAIVEGLVIQELDTNKNVVFQWRSWDHFSITDSNIDLTTPTVDYVHGNSIELDDDGNILLSSRHLDELTKIDRATGDVVWRLGGTQNEFTLYNDTWWFSRQHDCRRLDNGNISMFDNGNSRARSRSIEYAIDETNKTITRVWEHLSTPAVWGWAMGSSQRLAGGHTTVGWGAANPTITEVRPDSTKAFEMTMPEGIYSYRAYKFDWDGNAALPYLWGYANDDKATLGFAKFGDESVVRYNIYQGTGPNPTVFLDSTGANTFDVTGLPPDVPYYFRVTAVDDQSNESPFSNNVAITLDYEPPTGILTPMLGPTLGQNYPNPFNPTTLIPYTVGARARVRLAIYRVDGRRVRRLVDEIKPPGIYRIEWDGLTDAGSPASSGVYFYRLKVGAVILSRSLTLLR